MAGVSERDRLRVAWVLMGISAVLIGVGLVIIWSNDSESDSIIKPSPLQLQHLKSSASSVSQPAESASQPTDVVTHNIVAHNAVAHTNNAAAPTPSADRKKQAQLIRNVLFLSFVLLLIFLVGSLAYLRWSRSFRRWVFYRPQPPTPSEDLWAMHKLPDDTVDEWTDSTDGTNDDNGN